MLTSYETLSWSGNLNRSKDVAPWTQVESLKINIHIFIVERFPQIFCTVIIKLEKNYYLKTDLRGIYKFGVPDTYTYPDPHTQTYWMAVLNGTTLLEIP
jgi:alpha-D-ribose 1-methylphosphonate 5-phosphate C-P lyase